MISFLVYFFSYSILMFALLLPAYQTPYDTTMHIHSFPLQSLQVFLHWMNLIWDELEKRIQWISMRIHRNIGTECMVQSKAISFARALLANHGLQWIGLCCSQSSGSAIGEPHSDQNKWFSVNGGGDSAANDFDVTIEYLYDGNIMEIRVTMNSRN